MVVLIFSMLNAFEFSTFRNPENFKNAFAKTLLFLCCGFDSRLNPRIGAATADISAHIGFDVFIARIGIVFEQGHGTHDLSGLAVAALCHIVFEPGLLYRVITLFGQTLDGCDLAFFDLRNGQLAGANGIPVQVYRTGAAKCHPATVFGALQVEVVPQYPKQGRGWVQVYPMGFSVDFQIKFGHKCKNLNGKFTRLQSNSTSVIQRITYEIQTFGNTGNKIRNPYNMGSGFFQDLCGIKNLHFWMLLMSIGL